MIFEAAESTASERAAIERIERLRAELQHLTHEPRRWQGSLRRMAFARAVQGSNSIEGYNASLDDVAATLDAERPLNADEETEQALVGYRDAMTYVLQSASDPERPAIDEGTIKALHFMMIRHDLGRSPGQWRSGDIFVHDDRRGEVVYTGPPTTSVPELMDALVEQLTARRAPVLIRAAMAHLNLVMIHPFRDGNGRMGRCLQTFVLAREQILAPVFSSIEEYLGRNTADYYEVLAEVGHGAWNPAHDARPWIRFCLTAHYRQARTHLRRHEELAALWGSCSRLAEASRLPERVTGVLLEAAVGMRVRNATLRRIVETTHGDTVTALTASRDLRAMVVAGLIEPVGEKRARHYVAAPNLARQWQAIRSLRLPRAADDPFSEPDEQLSLDS